MPVWVTWILNFIWGKIVALFTALGKKLWRRKEIKDEAAAILKPIKDAQTGEEIDEAADDAFRRM